MHDSSGQMIVLESVESTNNYAMALVKNNKATDGISVFSFDQTAGKGRLGRQWISQPGSNIHLSIITQMQWASLQDQFYLSMIGALSVVRLIQKYTGLEVFVKWPNDIIINDRKAAGILIENVIRGHNWQWSITGIGLNVNQSEFENANATSIFLETSKEFEPLHLAQELKEIFLTALEPWRRNRQNQWLDQYNAKLYKRGDRIKLQAGSRIFETILMGVSNEGKLLTKDTFECAWEMNTARVLY